MERTILNSLSKLVNKVQKLTNSLILKLRYLSMQLFGYLQQEIKPISYDEYWLRRGDERVDSITLSRSKIFESWISDGSMVLDVGCGNGNIMAYLAKKSYSFFVGIDVSLTACRFSSKKGFDVVQATADKLPFRSRSFDHALCSEVLEHTLNSEEVLLEIERVAKKEVLIAIPNSGYWIYRFRLLLGKFPVQTLIPTEYVRFWTLSDFRVFAKRLGFQVLEVKAADGFYLSLLRRLWPSLFGFRLCFLLSKKDER